MSNPEVLAALRRLELGTVREMGSLRVEIVELRGKVSQLPTLVPIIATVLAVNALSFGVANLLARH